MAKDLFSDQATRYAKFRPSYPKELFDYISSFVTERNTAWDCATGNGQSASVLSNYFKKIEATDISEAQLNNAVIKPNINYQVAPAEQTPFADNNFDLITIATAYHWVNWQAFHKEACRVGKNNCVIAAWAYYILITDDEAINKLYKHFYENIIRPYWNKERRFVDEQYKTVRFDFDPLPVQPFSTKLRWSKEQFIGYINTWSATQNYMKKHRSSPVLLIQKELDQLWDEPLKEMTFPICIRLGRVVK
jgi:ubiquinone/menaquinone biosynthesis C-methylase UbiE